MRRKLLIGGALLVLLLVGAGAAAYLKLHEKPGDRLETTVTGVTLVEGTTTAPVVTHPKPPVHHPKPAHHPKPKPKAQPRPTPHARTYRYLPGDVPSWLSFGGDPQHSLARPNIHLGLPTKPIWARRM